MNPKANKNLFPEKRVSSIGFILNEEQKILLVKPSYYKFWHLPGGFVDEHESPPEAIQREILEEINLNLEPSRLMMVDYETGGEQTKEVLVFIFDFGIVDKQKFNGLKVDNAEIIEYGFFDKEQAMKLVGPERSKRLEICYQAHGNDEFYYLNNHETFPDNQSGDL